MKRLPTLLLACVPFFTPAAFAAEEWPRWAGPRGDETWNGPPIAQKLESPALPVVWKRPLGGGYSGITTSNGRAYTMDRPSGSDGPLDVERIVCFDPATGKDIWALEYPADYGDLTYNNGPRGSVTIHEGKAYALGAVGHVHCLDAASGKPLWKSDTMKEHAAARPIWGFAASPFIYDNLVLVQVGARPVGCLVAFNKDTGEVAWKGGEDGAGYCTPMVIKHPAGVDQLILWTPDHVVGMDPKCGETQWKFPYKLQHGVSIAAPVYQEGLLMVSGYWHGARALKLGPKVTDMELAWTNEHEVRGLMSSALYRDGYAYMLDRQLGMTCFEYKSGKKVWDDGHKITPRANHVQAVVVALAGTDRSLVLNSDGELLHVRMTPKGYEELWRTKIIGKTWAHFAFHGENLIVRSDTEMVCVKLPVEK